MKPVLERIYAMEESLPFRIPVDPEILGIPVIGLPSNLLYSNNEYLRNK